MSRPVHDPGRSTAGLPRPHPAFVRDLRGGVRLALDGVQEMIDRAESLHERMASVSPPVGRGRLQQPARGLSGLMYRTLRGTAGVVGGGLDLALASVQAGLQPRGRALAPRQPQPFRDATVAALNALAGDHLERTGNPLAIEMQLLVRGPARPHVLLLAHGLGLDEQSWHQRSHDHGMALAAALGCTPVYLRYNSGRHVSTNGRQLAAELGRLVAGWPVAVDSLTLLGHGMGGLVLRSAAHQAQRSAMAWPALLRQMAFLGTPHHGAMLEREGQWLQAALGMSPYLAPLGRLAARRSEGIEDFAHGNLLDEDWAAGAPRDARPALPLPVGVDCFAIAGAVSEGASGDGLVPVASALGRHPVAVRDLQIPPPHHWVAQGVNHAALLRDEAVHQKLRQWLARTHP